MKQCTVLIDALEWELKGAEDVIRVGEPSYDLVVEQSAPDNEIEGLEDIDFFCPAEDDLFDGHQRFDLRGRVAKITACYNKSEQPDDDTSLEDAFQMYIDGPVEWELEDVEETSSTHSGNDFYRIDFEDVTVIERTKYQDMIEGVRDIIYECGQAVHGKLFDLSTSGVWLEWSEAQAVGATMSVTNDALHKTGDKNIDRLWELLDKMQDVMSELSPDAPPSQPAKIDFLDADNN